MVNWTEAIPDLVEKAKKQRDVIEEKERNLEITIEEWEELFTGKENNRIFIKMMIRLAMTRPIILKDYIKGEGQNQKFIINDITNAWVAAYNIIGGLFVYGMKEGNLIISNELNKEMDREIALESSDEEDSEEEDQSENSRSNENSSTGTLFTIQSAQTEATNRLYPTAGDIIKNATNNLSLK